MPAPPDWAGSDPRVEMNARRLPSGLQAGERFCAGYSVTFTAVPPPDGITSMSAVNRPVSARRSSLYAIHWPSGLHAAPCT
jgi:hypothetical protein